MIHVVYVIFIYRNITRMQINSYSLTLHATRIFSISSSLSTLICMLCLDLISDRGTPENKTSINLSSYHSTHIMLVFGIKFFKKNCLVNDLRIRNLFLLHHYDSPIFNSCGCLMKIMFIFISNNET